MTDTSTVIAFPKSKIVRENPQLDEVKKAKDFRSTQKFADAVTEEIISLVLTELDNYDFDLETEEFTKDYILFQDALRATIYRQVGVEHHLHAFVDNNVSFVAMSPEESKISKEKFQKKMEKALKEVDED